MEMLPMLIRILLNHCHFHILCVTLINIVSEITMTRQKWHLFKKDSAFWLTTRKSP